MGGPYPKLPQILGTSTSSTALPAPLTVTHDSPRDTAEKPYKFPDATCASCGKVMERRPWLQVGGVPFHRACVSVDDVTMLANIPGEFIKQELLHTRQHTGMIMTQLEVGMQLQLDEANLTIRNIRRDMLYFGWSSVVYSAIMTVIAIALLVR